MPFKIVRNDITKMKTQAIVNTASASIGVGDGCDRAIYNAAGYDELLSYRKERIGTSFEGDAFVTPGFSLHAKCIIHAVSPIYIDGKHGEEDKLRSCYKKSLNWAKKLNIKSIAFPLISTGSFGYPKEEGMRIAVDEINSFLLHNDMEIYLVVFDTKATMLGEKIYPDLEAYIDHNYVQEKRIEEYGDAYFGSVAPTSGRYESYRRERDELERRTQRWSDDDYDSEESHLSDDIIERPYYPQEDNKISSVIVEPPPSGGMYDFSEEFYEEESDGYDFDFEEEHQSKLEERMLHMSDTFSEYLLYLIKDKGMENMDVWKRAIIDKKIFSKIKNNKDYHPQKITALCLCIGARLNLDESKDLLARAGYAFSPCDKTDVIFSYFIEKKIYDMIELDIQLEEHGLPCVIK